ncbi:hypothetical protein [Ornithinimicrobium flavum]|uniref:hypothetical protein n=1 Tax=Ornithinimicrobium flavum TaxID=1288636 RepID=UPI00106FB138|nr:hypothetical protein [Ornithinimicrobium flavum]
MRTALEHPLVLDYLNRLHAETVRLPVPEGRELEAQIREHLVAALPPEPAESEVRDVLDRLGDPVDLVDAAGGAGPGEGPTFHAERPDAWREVGALVGLVGGTLLFWLPLVNVVLWVGGLVLLVLSRRWSVTDKVWGALVLGLAPWIAIVAGALAFVTTGEVCQTDAAGNTACSDGGDGGLTALNVAAIALTVGFVGLYLWTLVRLVRRAARSGSAGRSGLADPDLA